MNKKKLEKHERMYGPHFNEECALKVVRHMENEDGSRGAHWSLELAMTLALQYGVNFNSESFNKYDWYVALNMIYSDYYKAVTTVTNTDHARCFVELAKAWLKDKDVDEGKMWYYYKYIMCDELRSDDDEDDYEEYDYDYKRNSRRYPKYDHYYDEDMEEDRFSRKIPPYHRRDYLSKYY